jgi:anti-sigma factor RsiW
MTCQGYDDRLGDYVDGTLVASARLDVEAHLARCARCRAVVIDFEAIRSMARTLEPVLPSPQVWQRISVAAASRKWWWSRLGFAGWQPALASAMAVLLTTGMWWVGTRLSAGGAQPSTAAVTDSQSGAPVIVEAEQQTVEAHYTSAIARLEQATSADRSALDPETADALDAGLTVIDEAIVESRVALQTQPESELAQVSLFEALRRKVALLQDMLALINEMRQGNQDAAARIMSELNQ